MTACSEPTVAELIVAAVDHDQSAWCRIVERYTPLVIATAHRYRLSEHDVADVAQTVWLRSLEHLSELRNPAALPGWLATTTRHECLRVIGRQRRQHPVDPRVSEAVPTTPDVAEEVAGALEQSSRLQAVLVGFAELPDSDRRLLALLSADPPKTYTEISQRLGIPVGSIGPTRGRALKRLRATAAVSQLLDEPGSVHEAASTGIRGNSMAPRPCS